MALDICVVGAKEKMCFILSLNNQPRCWCPASLISGDFTYIFMVCSYLGRSSFSSTQSTSFLCWPFIPHCCLVHASILSLRKLSTHHLPKRVSALKGRLLWKHQFSMHLASMLFGLAVRLPLANGMLADVILEEDEKCLFVVLLCLCQHPKHLHELACWRMRKTWRKAQPLKTPWLSPI